MNHTWFFYVVEHEKKYVKLFGGIKNFMYICICLIIKTHVYENSIIDSSFTYNSYCRCFGIGFFSFKRIIPLMR